MPRFLLRLVAVALAWLAVIAPAQAAVTITFWSHELGNSFPHAFITLRGIPDAGGEPVDGDWGFTAVSITPALLWGPVRGKVESSDPGYIRSSDAQFSVVLTDTQYADVLRLMEEWSDKGDPTYRLESRNCVTFVQEAARRAGVATIDFPKLMKKPRSFLKAVAAANPGQVTVIAQRGRDYLATLAPVKAPLAPDMHVAPVVAEAVR